MRYPGGLKGTDIALSGRIVAVTDVFDALCSNRPYKEPFTVEKSFSIIRSEAGKHFDSTVVDAFFAVQSEILDIKNQFKDEQEDRLIRFAGGTTGDRA